MSKPRTIDETLPEVILLEELQAEVRDSVERAKELICEAKLGHAPGQGRQRA